MSLETKVIKSRLGLLGFAEELGNVSRACKYLGYSKDTFYRYKELFDEGGELALQDMNYRAPNVKNRIDRAIEEQFVAYANLTHGGVLGRVSNELKKRGVFVSSCGVRCVWLCHNLEMFQNA
jgi:hypothetical protein